MRYIKEYTQLNAKEHRQLFYKRLYKSAKPEWDDSMVKLRDLVANHLPEKACVLDAGCGNGNYVIDELRSHILHVVGVDIDHAVTEKNISADQIVYSDLEHLPFADNEFDAVVSLWVLEHLNKPEQVFSEIARVLKPGGFFAFITPNQECYLIKLRHLMHDTIASYLVEILYGRKEVDQFSVNYSANTCKVITKFAQNSGLEVLHLKTNADPSYTSFGWLSQKISFKLAATNRSLFNPHLLGLLTKPK